MESKTCLVLGSGSDLAQAIAKQLACQGWHLQLIGRNAQSLEAHVEVLSHIAPSVESFCLDLRDFEQVMTTYKRLQRRPDVVLLAGAVLPASNQWLTDEQLSLTLNTNAIASIRLLHGISAAMRVDGLGGVIIGISSIAGVRGRRSNYVYGASKAALTTYLSGLRADCATHGIHVMTVIPGFIATKMLAHEKTPRVLTADPEAFASRVIKGLKTRSDYVDGGCVWRIISWVIQFLPEYIFKRLPL